MFEIRWVSSPAGLLLWAEVVLGLAIIHHANLFDRPMLRRGRVLLQGLAALALVLGMAGFGWRSLILGAWSGGVIALLGAFQGFAERRKLEAEVETAGTVLVVAGSGWLIGATGLMIRHSLVTIPLPSHRLTAVILMLAIILFSVTGGTRIVRGILRKAGTLPKQPTGSPGASPVDTAEYNRGRVIGNLERLLLVVAIALEAYSAMGFIIAAKGLIRIKEFENRDFAEYFLIGTFTSVIVALGLGLLLRATVINLW